MGYRAWMRVRLAILLLLAALPAVAGAAVRPALVGTNRADLLTGREGSDRVVARAATTGSPWSTTAAWTPSRAARAATSSPRTPATASRPTARSSAAAIHRDLTTNSDGQHESEVEPDSQTVGLTTVAVFQVGRTRTGGAASIGFSTSKDGGRTWRQGILPGLTQSSTPPGPSARASDPVVAWDAAHGVWLASSLAIGPGVSRLTIHRSTDGLKWTGPIDAAFAEQPNLAYDKNWLTCDNGPASPFRGRCYLAYTLVGDPRGRRGGAALGRRRPHLVGGGHGEDAEHGRDPGRASRTARS